MIKGKYSYLVFTIVLFLVYLLCIYLFNLSLVPLLFVTIAFVFWLISYFTTKINYNIKLTGTIILYIIAVITWFIIINSKFSIGYKEIICCFAYSTLVLPLCLVRFKDKIFTNLLTLTTPFVLGMLVSSAFAMQTSDVSYLLYLTIGISIFSVLLLGTILLLNYLQKSNVPIVNSNANS